MVKAIFWDFGGVITTSPFEAFNRYEAERGLPRDFIRMTNATNPDSNAWAQLEANRIDIATFDRLFEEETKARGHAVPGRHVIERIYGDVRPQMVNALRRLRQTFLCACLTNNFLPQEGRNPKTPAVAEAMNLFHFVVESSLAGVRKPDPAFYRIALDRAQLPAKEVVMLDDLGVNLRTARALGMRTIKVADPAAALDELSDVTGVALD